MAWRLHLSDRTIKRLDILPGKPTLLAAWTSANRVTFLDLQNGTQQGDCTLGDAPVAERAGQPWADYLRTLAAPNGVYLPTVRSGPALISLSADGKICLCQTEPGVLYLAVDDKEAQLPVAEQTTFIAVALDRAVGLVAALDAEAKLHLYQGVMRIGIFETGLTVDEEFRPALVLAQGGSAIFLSDGTQVLRLDGSGQVRKQLRLHYTIGAISCSPDGNRFVVSDLDDNVVRIYDGDLLPTHQRHAVDLLTEAKRSQLLASAATSAALGPLAISNKGALAFALAGTVCVTNLARLKAHPKPAS